MPDRKRRLPHLPGDVWVLLRVVIAALIELVLLDDWLSASRFAERTDLLGSVILALPGLATLLLTVLGGCSLGLIFSSNSGDALRPRPFWSARLVVQLIVFAVCLLWGRVVFASDHVSSAAVIVWLTAMVVAGFALLWWAADLLDWSRFIDSEHRALGGGAALGFVAWMVAVSAPRWWSQLAPYTLHNVHALLKMIYAEPVVDVTRQLIGTTQFQVIVAPGCSGVDGMALMTAYVAAALILFRHHLRFPHALLMIPLACGLSWLLNSVRITLLIVMGTEWSREVAVAGFHSESGWVFFNLTALVAVCVMLKSSWLLAGRIAAPTVQRRADLYLLPFIVLSLTQLMGLALSDGWTRYPWWPTIITAAVLFAILWRRSWSDAMATSWQAMTVAIVVGVGVFGLWIWLVDVNLAGEMLRQRVLELSPFERSVWIVARCVGSVIVVPVVEELAFRGYLMRRLQGDPFDGVAYRDCRWWSVGLSSLAFGVLHPDALAGIAAGLVFGALTVMTNRLGPAILAHAVANLLIAVAVLGAGQWGLWG